MGMIDRLDRFCNAQAITASAGSTDQIDTKSANTNIGKGNTLYWNTVCVTAMTDSGSDSTVTATIETDADSAFGSPTLAVQTQLVFSALSAAGTVRSVKLQPFTTLERYVRVYFTVANGNLDTGSFTSWLSTTPVSGWTAKPNGYDV
jgi:hypothetical protein